MVHGQVVLNQFKNYPLKAVREAAFVGALKQLMAQRRHHKLYAAPKQRAKASRCCTPSVQCRIVLQACGKAKQLTYAAAAPLQAARSAQAARPGQ